MDAMMSCLGSLYPSTADSNIVLSAKSENISWTDSGYSSSSCCPNRQRLSHDTVRAQYCLDERDPSMSLGQPTISRAERAIVTKQRNPWLGKRTLATLLICNQRIKELSAAHSIRICGANEKKSEKSQETSTSGKASKASVEARVRAALIPEWPSYHEYLASSEHFQYIDFKNTERRTANQVYRHSWALEQAKNTEWRQRTGSILLYDWNTYPTWRNGEFARDKFGRPKKSLPGESA